ncbi:MULTISPECIES: hypothetical protein [Dickeya]|uniref:Uncharacterized protein n=1 Tax=Dickeya lacustris TaxID=2259638 RepID=A0ABY8G5H6_9GAMM|nr:MULTISPECIES: hypothetical protein [Dickeya]WFN55202.1 hypothetical protein O1Q98_16500 [Dickeya lacustris]WJM86488.1 hypothetical protein QUF31_05060 [Dickeya chrysanthemi]
MSVADEIEYMSNLESKFQDLYKKIKYNQDYFYLDDELGAVRADSNENGKYIFDEPFKYTKIAGSIHPDTHREVIKIITIYLDEGWKMPSEMREYLSERFKKAINPNPKNLDSLFGLRPKERIRENDRNKKDAVYYIMFRKSLHKELKPKHRKNPFFRIKALNDSLCDELSVLFFKNTVSNDKLKDLIKEGKLIGLNDDIRQFYCEKDIECLVKYRGYLSDTIIAMNDIIPTENNQQKLDTLNFILAKIEQKLHKLSFIKATL